MRQDQLDELLMLQAKLQRDKFQDVSRLTRDERVEFITWNVLALTDELHEALNETSWKPWVKDSYINEEAFKGELIDALHFLTNLLLVSGMDGHAVMKRYRAKREVNAKRQEDGYDGRSSKCPVCKRALDDPAVSCTVDVVSGRAECAR